MCQGTFHCCYPMTQVPDFFSISTSAWIKIQKKTLNRTERVPLWHSPIPAFTDIHEEFAETLYLFKLELERERFHPLTCILLDSDLAAVKQSTLVVLLIDAVLHGLKARGQFSPLYISLQKSWKHPCSAQTSLRPTVQQPLLWHIDIFNLFSVTSTLNT